MATRNLTESDPLTPYEKQAELRRILESKFFAKAPKRRLFLEFTTGRALQGEGEKLNEYLIGVEVYERGSDFDPQQDPIVRVQAHEIRRALKSYYQEEGKLSPFRIDLPAGQYAPVFSRVQPPDGGVASTATSEPAAAAPTKHTSTSWQHILIVVLSLACVGLGVLYLREHGDSQRAPSPVTGLPESEEWFWKPFLKPDSPPLVVVPVAPVLRFGTGGDSPETLRGGYVIPKDKLPTFRETLHFQELKKFVFVPSTTDYTGVGEAMGLVRLLELFARQGATMRIKPSRLTDYTEIQAGNTIMLGGGNEWTNRVLFTPQGFSVSQSEGAFRNLRPRGGEPEVFTAQFDSVTNRLVRDFAVIFVHPNQSKDQRLVLLTGIYTQGTEAAAEFVTSPQGMAELRRALLAESPDKKSLPPFFEALITVPVQNDVPGGASLVAVRTIQE